MSEPTKRCDGSCPLIQDDATVYVPEQRAEAAEVEVERLRGEVTLWKLAAETRGEALAEAEKP